MSATDSKINIINEQLNEQLERFDNTLSEFDSDIKANDQQFAELRIQINERLHHSDAKKIWDYFKRFADYSDLKDLYNRVIPEIAKFEQKIIDF